MAEAFKIAKGFLPVIEFPAAGPPETKLLVPLVFVVLEIPPLGPLTFELLAFTGGYYDAPFPPAVGCEVRFNTSPLNCSIL